MNNKLIVDTVRIERDLEALAALTDEGMPYTRRAFTPAFAKGRAYLQRKFEEAGPETAVDTAGSVVGRRSGLQPNAGVITLGSHEDGRTHTSEEWAETADVTLGTAVLFEATTGPVFGELNSKLRSRLAARTFRNLGSGDNCGT